MKVSFFVNRGGIPPRLALALDIILLADPAFHQVRGLLHAALGYHSLEHVFPVLGVAFVEPALEGVGFLIRLSPGEGYHVGPVVVGALDFLGIPFLGLIVGVPAMPSELIEELRAVRGKRMSQDRRA